MKKLLCFLLCLTLIFSSVSLAFAATADWTTSDQQNLQNVASRLFYMNQSAAYYLYNIASSTNSIYNKLVDVYSALFDSGHSVAWWASAISSYMSPILSAIQQTPLDLEKIWLALGTTYNDDGTTVYRSFLQDLLTNDNVNGFEQFRDGTYVTYWSLSTNGTVSTEIVNQSANNWRSNLLYDLHTMSNMQTRGFSWLLRNYASTQTSTNWADLTNSSYNPYSTTDGIYYWLSKIQEPVARLSYVLASDERIEAQEAAAANEEAVVDNFIDSSGSGAASPSDIGSVSGLSSGYKQNFATDASPSGIFDIFNSDHATWFSQETKNQLDTTTPSRMSKDSASETPLLDKQIEDIYDALGVKQP